MTATTPRTRTAAPTAVVVVAGLLTGVLALAGLAAAAPAAGAAVEPGGFVPVTVTRLFDSRTSQGGPGCLAPGVPTSVQVTPSRGGLVPSNVGAVVVNLTVLGATTGGHVTAYPAGAAPPTASTLNYGAGQTVNNGALVAVGTGGRIEVVASGGCPEVLVDVTGYTRNGRRGSSLTAVTPRRVIDTRPARGGTGPVCASKSVVVAGGTTGIPSDATGVAVNLTVVAPVAAGRAALLPYGTTPISASSTSTVNYTAGQVLANNAVVPVGPGGQIVVKVTDGCTNFLVDVTGYTRTTQRRAGSVLARSASRYVDTRNATGGSACISAERLVGSSGVLGPAGTVFANVTVTGATAGGYLVVMSPLAGRSTGSVINYAAGQTVANGVPVQLDRSGRLRVFASGGCPHVVVDVTATVTGSTRAAATPASSVAMPSAAAGGTHTCAVLDDQRVKCWGRNAAQQLGTGDTTDRAWPTPVRGVGDAVAVTAGDRHTCVLVASGTVRCFGANESGQLGTGTTGAPSGPVTVRAAGSAPGTSSTLTGVTQLSAAGNHTCAVLTGGAVRCWGANAAGQLGDGTTTTRTLATAVGPVDAPLTGVRQVATGLRHTCAVTTGGGASCWGENSSGELADGTAVSRTTPGTVYAEGAKVVGGVLVPKPPLTGVSQVAVGDDHTCFLLSTSATTTPRCSGSTTWGALGTATSSGTSALYPAQVRTYQGTSGTASVALVGVAGIAAGGSTTCVLAVGTSPSVMCWGRNDRRQVGITPVVDATDPTAVTTATALVQDCSGGPCPKQAVLAVTVAVGAQHTCAADYAGAVRCWGSAEFGRAGNGQTVGQVDRPPAVPAPLEGAASVALSPTGPDQQAHSCAVGAGGADRCWGAADAGQVLTPLVALTDAVTAPGRALGSFPKTQHALADRTTCALLVSRNVVCSGEGGAGQLGDDLGTDRTSLAPVLDVTGTGPLADVTRIVAGNSHLCALRATGNVVCWGANTDGALGDGSTVADRRRPVAVRTSVDGPALSGVADLAAGNSSTCALLASGTVRCWGRGEDGQLGRGSRDPSSLPVEVSGLTDAVQIAGSDDHYCVVVRAGGVRCWGFAVSKRYSITERPDDLVPVAVPLPASLNPVVKVVVGTNHSCVMFGATRLAVLGTEVDAPGSVRCWGSNTPSGRLGTGRTEAFTAFSDAATEVVEQWTSLPLGDVDDLFATGSTTCAVTVSASLRCWGANLFGQAGGSTAAQPRAVEVPGFG